jgi:hypothetical protein
MYQVLVADESDEERCNESLMLVEKTVEEPDYNHVANSAILNNNKHSLVLITSSLSDSVSTEFFLWIVMVACLIGMLSSLLPDLL